ncbi:hypothetical protein [Ureibacillus acetophenoni]|uniref:Prepilin-type N-terminal cleavage/methylation domain-containing protein n=1 Tax=Ureibacillus acetophenoni TaxID=614649 RepID=A0A285U8N4_9BACL|nr:hypothetical protein [Ureibacillus acetophenoni]SOC38280.1 hypothetical protein SAMN05877842_10481 [Ureibacillus acetophenoni]
MIIKNQNGVSLVEILATFILVSIVGLLAWNIFFQGTNYSKNAMTKNQMYQEANVIISTLTKIHQKNQEYTISSSDCTIEVLNSGHNKIFETKNSQMCYTIPTTTVIKSHTNIRLPLSISDNSTKNNTIEVNIQLHRLKNGG